MVVKLFLQYDVDFSVQSKRLASCGNNLNVVAVSEVEYGKGKSFYREFKFVKD